MNINIPFQFAAHTQVHSELIDFSLPPVANKIYYWLLARCKAGTEQEFDKADFDRFCSDRGRNPFSIYWFTKNLKRLFETRLVQLVRKYSGYGYKVIVYHPWQVDDWLILEEKNTTKHSNKSCKKSNKSWSNSNESCKKSTSNTYTAVPLYRENRENKDRTAIVNGSTEENTTSKIQNFIAAKKKEYKSEEKPAIENSSATLPVDKSPNRPLLSPPKIIPPIQKLNANSEDSKSNSVEALEIDPRDKIFRKADVDVFDKFLDRLDDYGIEINQTVQRYLVKYIKRGKITKIETALELYRSRKRDRVIAEPAAYFIQLLKENIAKVKTVYSVNDNADEQENQSKFNHWLELAKEVGTCSGYEIVDGKIIVNMNGTKELWESAFNRGYNFEYFKNALKKK